MSRNDFSSDYLEHHGILGMKWGIRRYQNEDGSLTSAGRERYGVRSGGGINDISSSKGIKRRLNDVDKAIARNKYKRGKAIAKVNEKAMNSSNAKNASKADAFSKNINKGEEEINSLLKKASDMGYDVNSKDTLRMVSSGQEILGRTLLRSALVSAALLPLGRVAVIPGYPSYVKGKKYDVKDTEDSVKNTLKERGYDADKQVEAYKKTGDASYITKANGARDAAKKVIDTDKKSLKEKFAEANQRARERTSINAAVERGLAENKAKKATTNNSSKLSDKTIKSRVEYARKTGKFDMEFLERMDRYVDEENHSKAEVLKGYEKYLKEHGDEFYKKK